MLSYLRSQKLVACLSLKKRYSIAQNLEAVIQNLVKLARVKNLKAIVQRCYAKNLAKSQKKHLR